MKKLLLIILVSMFSSAVLFAISSTQFAELKQKAEQGDATAQFELSTCYDKGDGVEKNSAESVKWLRKSAEQGFADAQNRLGCCYAKGEGVIENYILAYAWVALARKNGEDVGDNMSYLEKKLTAVQQEKALKIAREFDKGNFSADSE